MTFASDLDEIDGLLGPDKEINLYRIIQEGLNNVIKHSQASQVIVEIKRQQTNISVSILDDGKGFDPAQLNGKAGKQPSFGLTGIKERAKVLDGVLTLQSAPGTGTRLTVNVPLSNNGK
jgi:signal transduction histidine kinase